MIESYMAFYLLSKIEADILEKAINFLTAFTAILFLKYRMKIQTPENYKSCVGAPMILTLKRSPLAVSYRIIYLRDRQVYFRRKINN